MSDHLFNYFSISVKLGKPRIGKVTAKGQILKLNLYPISDLAVNLNRTSYTLRRWESWGWIPKPVFKIKNQRYYTRSQIQLMTYLTIKYDIRQKNKGGRGVGIPTPQEFIDELHEKMLELNKFILAGQVIDDIVNQEV
jgi:hypothetical protein